jgi:hypothetical protein
MCNSITVPVQSGVGGYEVGVSNFDAGRCRRRKGQGKRRGAEDFALLAQSRAGRGCGDADWQLDQSSPRCAGELGLQRLVVATGAGEVPCLSAFRQRTQGFVDDCIGADELLEVGACSEFD